jgi:hypothetical protein
VLKLLLKFYIFILFISYKFLSDHIYIIKGGGLSLGTTFAEEGRCEVDLSATNSEYDDKFADQAPELAVMRFIQHYIKLRIS